MRHSFKNKMQIDDLKTELEIINPIESKKILGGDWYDDWWIQLDEVYLGSTGGDDWWEDDNSWWQDFSDPNYWDNDYYGNGSSDNGETIPNLPSTVEQQLGSMGACVSYAMAFMSTTLGHPITGANMALDIAQTQGLNMTTVLQSGLDFNQTNLAIANHFNFNVLHNVADIQNAVLNNNHGVLANLYVPSDPNMGHEVVIVDYIASSNNVLIADSNTGTYHYVSANDINFNGGVFEIINVIP